MNCEVLCIGTEILHGDIVNSNAAYISKNLASIGIDVHYHSVVGDNPKRMKAAFDLAFSRADVVICTGGLGPTKDDITKDILAEYFNLPMEFDEKSLEHLKMMYGRLKKEMPENNLRQTYFPKGSIILTNNNGTANACIVDNNKKIGVLLPGPPREMMPLMDEQVIPYLSNYSHETVVGYKVAVMNVGESMAETIIMDLIDNQTNPTIAPYANEGKMVFRVTAKAENKEKADELIKPVISEILKRFGENAFVLETDKAEDMTCKKLIASGLTISTAESCTGGLIASKLVSYPGISEVFKEGFVTYSNEAKIRTLGVKKETIDKFSEVSEEVVKEMAEGACRVSGADIAIATTGIAGPNGGTEDKPVGLVYTCVYYKGKYNVLKNVYTGNRDAVRERSAINAIELVRKSLL
jgi:nicotinamide-nucleotide amidase